MPDVLTKTVAAAVLGAAVATAAIGQQSSAPQPSSFVAQDPITAQFKRWDLTPDELIRLREVYDQERAFSDVASLTPYEILGKHARSKSERAQMAKRYVEATIAHQRRSLEWTVAVAAALDATDAKRELLTASVSNYLAEQGYTGAVSGALPRGVARETPFLDKLKRLHVFLSAAPCEGCDQAFATAIERMDSGEYSGVDVVFIDMEDEDRAAANAWALRNGVTNELIRDRKLTLNYDTEDWRAERGAADPPVLIDSSTGEWVGQ